MDMKKLILGTLAGGIVYFLLGYLVYAMLMADFFASHSSAGAIALMKSEEEMKFYPLAMGNLAHAALLAYVFLKWANIKSFGEGLMGGAVIGLLMAAGFDLIMYDTMKMMSITGICVDIIVYTIMTAVTGGVVGAVLGMGNKG